MAAAAILGGDERAGVLGQVHPQVAAQFEIDAPVFLFEVDVEKLLPVGQDAGAPPSRYRASRR